MSYLIRGRPGGRIIRPIAQRRRAFQSGGPYSRLTSNLTLQYKCNEASGNLLDSKGLLDLTITGTVGTAAGKVSTARSFDGSSYFMGAASLAVQPISVDFSGSCWLYMGGLIGTQMVYALRNDAEAGLDGKLHFLLRTEGTALKLYIGSGVEGEFTATTINAGISATTWYHVAWSFNTSTKELRYSLSGAAVSTATSSYSPTTSPATPRLMVGGGVGTEILSNFSRVDAIKLWRGLIITDAEMALDYNSGSGVEL